MSDPVLEAATDEELLAALSGAIQEGGEVPTAADLAAWLVDAGTPAACGREANARLAEVVGAGAEWAAVRSVPVRIDTGGGGSGGIELDAPSSPVSLVAVSASGHESLTAVHRAWAAMEARPRHPAAPLVAGWLERPRDVEPDIRRHPRVGILPAELAGSAPRIRVIEPEVLPRRPGPRDGGEGDGWLPGFEPGPGPLARVPLLDFLHDGGLHAFTPGPGAPWALRIAFETLIDVAREARDGRIARVEYPLRGGGETLQTMLYPAGRFNLSRDWTAFRRALAVVDRFTVPADGGRSAWLPIRVRSYPTREDGVLRLDVSLPPGSGRGPRILRRVLRRLGSRSYPQWRAWLALAYLWDRSAVNGQWIRASRPKVARDGRGLLLGADGAVLLDQHGRPVTRWSDPRVVPLDDDDLQVRDVGAAAREPNPEARLHPWLTAADVVALGYPPDPYERVSKSARSHRKARVLRDLGKLETEGLVVVETRPDGRAWRVLPPGVDPE